MTHGKTQYLTSGGLDLIKKEIQQLIDIKIPEIATRIDEAKEQGDLSENAEYHQAKDDMSWAQGRLIDLRHILDNAVVFSEKQQATDIVTIGSTVITRVNDLEKQFTIVGPQEIDPSGGRISNESPLGTAFLGCKIGDKVKINTPNGYQTYEIIKIK